MYHTLGLLVSSSVGQLTSHPRALVDQSACREWGNPTLLGKSQNSFTVPGGLRHVRFVNKPFLKHESHIVVCYILSILYRSFSFMFWVETNRPVVRSAQYVGCDWLRGLLDTSISHWDLCWHSPVVGSMTHSATLTTKESATVHWNIGYRKSSQQTTKYITFPSPF